MKDLTQEEWQKAIDNEANVEILDVRTQEEWDEGYIPSATLIDIHQPQEFMDAVNQLDKSKEYYIYCRSGGRSAQACQILDQMGFENTYNLQGGFSNWEGAKKKD
ncbi:MULTISPECIES: rhodanese-like domain-containing protein [Mesonia]|uniref:Rhodanese-related sulfurtransferase n=1 Tax=Mesonia algae TaxID=213248 RepID=A0A2W7HZW4_9FLAO|nr:MULTISPECIES: rhodanese-like domain-containing protein [Mesonia]PZW39598.1 rhodanese-related sulfurtransferase [Mesonia algae]TXK76190.1 rhodanese-like domain-containing protein [Mesonia sp. K4-1]